MQLGAEKSYETCKKVSGLSGDQIWMRDPMLQCAEEFQWYEEVFEFIQGDLEAISCKNGIITEGVAYLPKLMKYINIPYNRYISVTPEKEFQLFHYSKREFVPYILRECSDKQKAFENWMERDILFAGGVQQQCKLVGYKSFVNDGEVAIEDMVKMIEAHFELKA